MSTPVTAPRETVPSLPPVISDRFLSILRAYDVTEAFIFGSTVDGTDRPDSDIDLLVAFAKPTSLFRQIDLSDELARETGRPIDLMTAIHPAFEPYILPTLVALPL